MTPAENYSNALILFTSYGDGISWRFLALPLLIAIITSYIVGYIISRNTALRFLFRFVAFMIIVLLLLLNDIKAIIQYKVDAIARADEWTAFAENWPKYIGSVLLDYGEGGDGLVRFDCDSRCADALYRMNVNNAAVRITHLTSTTPLFVILSVKLPDVDGKCEPSSYDVATPEPRSLRLCVFRRTETSIDAPFLVQKQEYRTSTGVHILKVSLVRRNDDVELLSTYAYYFLSRWHFLEGSVGLIYDPPYFERNKKGYIVHSPHDLVALVNARSSN